MSVDLSNIIQETILTTIKTNISKDIDVEEILLCSKTSLENKNFALTTTSFNFEKLDSKITFIYPSHISSFIFNCIMMEDKELELVINDDIKDAMQEINSQIAGSLETAFNAQNYEELGTCKNETSPINLISDNSYEASENLLLLKLKIEDKSFQLFLDFNDQTIPYLSEFSNSKHLKNENKESLDENNDKETINDDEQTISEDDDEQIINDSDENDTKENEDINEVKIENIEDSKNKKIKLLIMIIAGLLVSTILAIIIMYFMGIFDETKVMVNDINKTKLSQRDMILNNIQNKEITYKSNMINIKKLNQRLSLLTKYEILELDILEKYKQEEQERLYKIKMQRLEEFASRNKEEAIFKQDLNKFKNKNRFKKDTNTSENIDLLLNEKLTLIEISANSYVKYKDFISKEKIKTTKISMCVNNGKTKVYIGPLYINLLINNIIKGISKKDGKIVTITKKEFNQICNF